VSFVSYVRKTNRTGRNRTRLYENFKEVQAPPSSTRTRSQALLGAGSAVSWATPRRQPATHRGHVGPLSELSAPPPVWVLHEVRWRFRHRSLLVSSGDLHQDDEWRAPRPAL